MGNHKKVNKGKNMNSKQINIAANIRNLRTGLGLSQDKLAQEFNVSVQAVSKWETGASIPDIMMLPKIADFFDISLDDLFYGTEEVQEPDLSVEQTNDAVYETENVTVTPDSSYDISSSEEPDISEDFEDDFKDDFRKFLKKDTIDYNNRKSKFLRRLSRFENESSDIMIHVIRYKNGQYIESVYEDDTTVKLEFSDIQDNKINIAVWGNAEINCNVGGNVKSDAGDIAASHIGGDVYCVGNVICGSIDGFAEAGGDITCDNVGGKVNAEGDVTCKDIGGDVISSGDVNCDCIGGAVKADGDITCGDVGGSVKSGGDVTCNNIEGSLCAGGDVECNNISGDVNCGGDVECENIDGSAEIGGSLNADTIKASVTAGGEINAETISNCILNSQR